MKTVKIKDLIGSSYASDDEQGDIIFKAVENIIKESNESLNIDFTEISLMTTAFLNNAIGRLFQEFDIKDIKPRIKFSNIKDKQDVEMLRLVLLNALEMNNVKKKAEL